jgi:putative ATP-dependent endonuclease of OLD family
LGGLNIKLESVAIKNFRNINELFFKFSDFNVLVGENNIGKTNILKAIYKILKINESPYRIRFDENDFFVDSEGNKSDKISIQLNFNELNENDHSAFVWKGIDSENNKLSIILEATWEEENSDSKIEVYFLRNDDEVNIKGEILKLNDKKYIPFYYIDAYRDIWRETQHNKGDLKQIFKDYNNHFLKPIEFQLKNPIKDLETHLTKMDRTAPIFTDLTKLLKELKEGNFNFLLGWDMDQLPSELENLKTKFMNIKQKIEINSKLCELQSIVNGLEGVDKIKTSLKQNLELFLPNNDQLEIELGKMEENDLFDETKIELMNAPILNQGSGFQNSFVMALKLSRLMANVEFSENKITNLIIAIEEPEAHMHPHLQRSFIKKLKKKQEDLLGLGINLQLIVTTHSPFILSQLSKSDICLVRKEERKLKITKLDDDFFSAISSELSNDKIKHFEYVFRSYPEIFLARGVIIIEGPSELGAIPEFANNMQDIELDDLGLTVICGEGKGTVKFLYLILKGFTKCVAIRDNDADGNNDDYLIDDPNETYYKTNLSDFENEIIDTVDDLLILKKILMQCNEDGCYFGLVKQYVPETRSMDNNEIIDRWEHLELEDLRSNLNTEKLLRSLKRNKNSLFWAIFCSDLSENFIPDCYKQTIRNAKDLVM